MEQGYLIDSNTAIDYLDNKLPIKSAELIDNVFIQISVITRMELLGWPKATLSQINILQQFISSALVYSLDEPIILKAIELRRNYRIKLPDAIIASTALTHRLTLVTRNSADFKNIDQLSVLDPWNLNGTVIVEK